MFVPDAVEVERVVRVEYSTGRGAEGVVAVQFEESLPLSAIRKMCETVDLGTDGTGTATIWTCDFSAEYVHINADYRT